MQHAHTSTHTRLLIPLTMLLALIAGLALAEQRGAPRFPRTPVEQEVLAGETATATVTRTAYRDLQGLIFTVSPELQDTVSVNPAGPIDLAQGESITLTLTFAPAADTLPGTIEGRVEARADDGSLLVQGLSFGVVVRVGWPTQEPDSGIFSISYPPFLEVDPTLLNRNARSMVLRNSDANGGEVYISWDENISAITSIEDWADQETWPGGDWRDAFTPTVVGGHPALRGVNSRLIIILTDSHVFSVENGIGIDPIMLDGALFEAILNSFTVNE